MLLTYGPLLLFPFDFHENVGVKILLIFQASDFRDKYSYGKNLYNWNYSCYKLQLLDVTNTSQTYKLYIITTHTGISTATVSRRILSGQHVNKHYMIKVVCQIKYVQTPGARPPGRLNFVLWRLMLLGNHFGTCVTSPLRGGGLEFVVGS
jgi:hypothetical protein